MSSRPTLFFLMSMRVGGKQKFRFFLLLPMWVVLDLTDMLDDLCRITAAFCRNVSYRTIGNGRQFLPDTLRATSAALSGCVMELAFETGPLDIVDIDVWKNRETVKLKLLTR